MVDELSGLLKDTWRFFNNHFYLLSGIILPWIIPLEIYRVIVSFYSSGDGVVGWLVMLPMIVAYPIYQGALIFFIASIVANERLPTKTCYALARKFWLPLMGLTIVTTIATFAGFMALVIPGLIIAARMMFSEFYCLLYEKQAMEAFSKSWRETKEHQSLLLFGLLVLLAITSLPVGLVEMVLTRADALHPILDFVFGVLNSILAIPLTVFSFRVFTLHQQMRGENEPETL